MSKFKKGFSGCCRGRKKCFEGMVSKTAFNRGQILYRIAEMLEGRKAQFIEELTNRIVQNHRLKKRSRYLLIAWFIMQDGVISTNRYLER